MLFVELLFSRHGEVDVALLDEKIASAVATVTPSLRVFAARLDFRKHVVWSLAVCALFDCFTDLASVDV